MCLCQRQENFSYYNSKLFYDRFSLISPRPFFFRRKHKRRNIANRFGRHSSFVKTMHEFSNLIVFKYEIHTDLLLVIFFLNFHFSKNGNTFRIKPKNFVVESMQKNLVLDAVLTFEVY